MQTMQLLLLKTLPSRAAVAVVVLMMNFWKKLMLLSILLRKMITLSSKVVKMLNIHRVIEIINMLMVTPLVGVVTSMLSLMPLLTYHSMIKSRGCS